MKDQFKNLMIGLFVVAAFGIIIFILLFLHPNIGNEGKILRVRFADVDKITTGTRVNFGGKPVGEVLEVREIKTENGKRIEHGGIIYTYELTLAIDSGVVVYSSDVITSRTSGLLGEKSVAIIPQPLPNQETPTPVTGEILYADQNGSVEDTLKELRKISNKVDIALNEFIDAMQKMRAEKMWENLSSSMDSLAEIMLTMNQPEKINSMFENADAIFQNLEETTAALNEPTKISEAIDNVHAATKDAKSMATKLDSMTVQLNGMLVNLGKGQGSLGSLLVKDDLYLRISSLLSKAEVTMNDINHYGLLFHLDKGWQRLRARRLNLMQTLTNAQEFRNYFNDELDKITTALERVSLVIEKSSQGCCKTLWQNSAYTKVYAELLRRVAMLEEYLQMYNQQAVECVVQQTEP